jgi:hypothetical protein
MAEGTSVEPAGEAEKAPIARPEAWEPRAYGRTGKGGRFEVARRQDTGRTQGSECQRGALMATARECDAMATVQMRTTLVCGQETVGWLAIHRNTHEKT